MTDTASPAPAPKAPTPGRGLKIAFAISLALNLAVAGLVAGAWLRNGGPGHGMPRDLGFGPFSEALSPKDHRALREAIRENLPALRADREAARTEFATLLSALRAEPYDPDAVSTALSAIVARAAAKLATGQELLATRIAAMSVEDRKAFADRLEAGLRRHVRQ